MATKPRPPGRHTPSPRALELARDEGRWAFASGSTRFPPFVAGNKDLLSGWMAGWAAECRDTRQAVRASCSLSFEESQKYLHLLSQHHDRMRDNVIRNGFMRSGLTPGGGARVVKVGKPS